MNKALHVLVYLFVILAGVALWFELQLFSKRSELSVRNRLQEDCLVSLASTIENEEPNKNQSAEIKLDISPVEAKIVDTPETEDVLGDIDYKYYLEQVNLPTYDWNNDKTRGQMRNVYEYDFEGKVVMDGNVPKLTGAGCELELLNKLKDAASAQQAKLNTTRAELPKLRKKLADVVRQLNELKPIARQDKLTIVERDEKIAKLEGEKADLENQIVKIKAQIDELNAEITSLKDEVVTAHDETEVAKEELAKSQKLVEQLKRLLEEAIRANGMNAAKGGHGNAVTSVPSGDKGKILTVNNEDMFAVVEFTPEAMKELKGDDMNRPIPVMEFGVKRPGFTGDAGEFVGRIRLRQEVSGKNYIICDILSDWAQDAEGLKANDIIFAD